jgi:hypothetical protein
MFCWWLALDIWLYTARYLKLSIEMRYSVLLLLLLLELVASFETDLSTTIGDGVSADAEKFAASTEALSKVLNRTVDDIDQTMTKSIHQLETLVNQTLVDINQAVDDSLVKVDNTSKKVVDRTIADLNAAMDKLLLKVDDLSVEVVEKSLVEVDNTTVVVFERLEKTVTNIVDYVTTVLFVPVLVTVCVCITLLVLGLTVCCYSVIRYRWQSKRANAEVESATVTQKAWQLAKPIGHKV